MSRLKAIFLIAAVAVSGLATAGARADQEKRTAISNADRSSQLNKHIGFIDLYVTSAINDAKFMSNLADAAPGAGDKAILTEAHQNLDRAIDKGLAHVAKLRAYKKDLAAAAGGSKAAAADADRQNVAGDAAGTADRLAKLDVLERHLRDARAAAKKLTGVQMADLSPAIDGVATQLVGADTAFRDIAKWTNYTRLVNTHLSTVPVRGDDLPADGSGVERDIDRGPGRSGAAPSRADPGAPPSIKEPVQPAPGSGSPTKPQPGADGLGK